MKNKDLTNKRCRDESTLKNIQDQIRFNQLELAKQKDPWELISIPKVYDQKIYPNKRNIVLSVFLVSIFISLLLALLKDFILGYLDDVGFIEKKLNANFLGSVSGDNSKINAKILDLSIKKISNNKDNKNKVNEIGLISKNTSNLISDYINSNKDIAFINLTNLDEIDNFQNILLIIDQQNSTSNYIKKINKYLDLYQEKNFYWIYIENGKII